MRLIYAGFLGGAMVCCLMPPGKAQGTSVGAPPIKVESNQVVVPVLVLEKKKVNRIKKMGVMEYVIEAKKGNVNLFDDLTIHGLGISDFHLFEDGQEQRLSRVLFEAVPTLHPRIHDNLGYHTETVGIGGGIWTISNDVWEFNFPVLPHAPSPQEMEGLSENGRDWPNYLLAYSPPSSPDGSCHQLTIKLDRPDSMIYARDEYCSMRFSAADPLNGTALGRKMQSDMASKRIDRFPLSVAAVPFLTTGPKSRVDISIEWPEKSLQLKGKDCESWPKFAVWGEVYRKEGDIALRFSDQSYLSALSDQALLPEAPESCTVPAPNRYETQVYLYPGQFSLRVILKVGEDFGRVEIPLTIPTHGLDQLTISNIALAKEFRRAEVQALDASAKSAGVFVPLISNYVQYTPTAHPCFRRSERFYFYFEVGAMQEPVNPPPCSNSASATDAGNECAAMFQANLRIVDAKTQEVVKALRPVDEARYAPEPSPIISIGGGIPIDDLPKGRYRLEAQATDANGRATPWSATSFSVEDDTPAQKTVPEGKAMQSVIEESSDANAEAFVDEPLDRLVARIPELKRLQPATDQEELPGILKAMGQKVDDFMHNIGDIIAHEDVTQERLNANGKIKTEERVQDEYLILRQGSEWDAGAEYRMDKNGNRLESIGLEKGYMVTSGFALSCISFSTTAQSKSRFRYLGKEKIGPLETYVLRFVQRPGEATLMAGMLGAGRIEADLLTQGILWVDKTSFQIIRMRTDLLSANKEIGREQGTTEVTFSEVKLPNVQDPLWLPSDVDVYLEIDRQKFRNVHRYTNYRLYRVSVKIGAGGPS